MENAHVITDAQLLAEYATKFTEEPAQTIKTQAPSSSLVKLLAGVMVNEKLETNLEVRELNGADEEAIAKSGTLGKSLNTILQRGVVKVGETAATDALLDQMVSGDRDLVMLAIRKLTFGPSIDNEMLCPRCGGRSPVHIDLDSDIPTKEFTGIWEWDVETSLGVVRLGLPKGSAQKKLMDGEDRTSAELSTLLISECIVSVDGLPVVPSRIALSMSIRDRETILQQIVDNTPGPRLLEVTTACKACEEIISTPLSLASLFRL